MIDHRCLDGGITEGITLVAWLFITMPGFCAWMIWIFAEQNTSTIQNNWFIMDNKHPAIKNGCLRIHRQQLPAKKIHIDHEINHQPSLSVRDSYPQMSTNQYEPWVSVLLTIYKWILNGSWDLLSSNQKVSKLLIFYQGTVPSPALCCLSFQRRCTGDMLYNWIRDQNKWDAIAVWTYSPFSRLIWWYLLCQ